MKLPEIYERIYKENKKQVILVSGRDGSKSKSASIITSKLFLSNANRDGIVARVSYGSMGDSCYKEFKDTFESWGEEIYNSLDFRTSPSYKIIKKNPTNTNSGTIYFVGYGGDTSRTKSFKSDNPLIFLIFEETQQLKNKQNLDDALASFRRRFGEDYILIIIGNPPAQELHWFNLYVEEKKKDKDFLVLKTSWLDCIEFLKDDDIKEILKTKKNSPEYYDWFYMGNPTGQFGCVYIMFREEKHVITEKELMFLLAYTNLKVVACIIGGDGAVNRDKTAFVPGLLLNNGQMVIVDLFVHNPKEDGVLSYHKLVEDHLTRWFDNLCKKYHLGTIEECNKNVDRMFNPIPIWFRIDSAAPDLVQECKFFFGGRANVSAIKKGTINEMVGINQSAIANNNIVVVDFGGHYNYVRNTFIKDEVNFLVRELKTIVWNEKQTSYDPSIPNDVCDAFTYLCYFWFSNNENLQYFAIWKNSAIKNMLICDILKERGS